MTRTVRKAPERPTRDQVVISMRGPWSSSDSIVAIGRRGTAWELEGSVGSAENGKQDLPGQAKGRRSRKHADEQSLIHPLLDDLSGTMDACVSNSAQLHEPHR